MIHGLIEAFIILTLVDAVLSFVPNPALRRHPMVEQLHKIVDVPQKPIRQMLPAGIPFDPSPFLVILALRLLQGVL